MSIRRLRADGGPIVDAAGLSHAEVLRLTAWHRRRCRGRHCPPWQPGPTCVGRSHGSSTLSSASYVLVAWYTGRVTGTNTRYRETAGEHHLCAPIGVTSKKRDGGVRGSPYGRPKIWSEGVVMRLWVRKVFTVALGVRGPCERGGYQRGPGRQSVSRSRPARARAVTACGGGKPAAISARLPSPLPRQPPHRRQAPVPHASSQARPGTAARTFTRGNTNSNGYNTYVGNNCWADPSCAPDDHRHQSW